MWFSGTLGDMPFKRNYFLPGRLPTDQTSGTSRQKFRPKFSVPKTPKIDSIRTKIVVFPPFVPQKVAISNFRPRVHMFDLLQLSIPHKNFFRDPPKNTAPPPHFLSTRYPKRVLAGGRAQSSGWTGLPDWWVHDQGYRPGIGDFF
jgi:hypothetical protein